MYPSLFDKDRSAEPEMQCRCRSLDGELRPVLGERVLACRFPALSLRPSQEPWRPYSRVINQASIADRHATRL
jgi:hypothetical protein